MTDKSAPKQRATHGKLECSFAVGAEQLFVEGWFIASTDEILSVDVLLEGSEDVDRPFQSYLFERGDVERVHAAKLEGGLHAIGYRLLIEHACGEHPPTGLRLSAADGRVSKTPASELGPGMSFDEKLKRLANIPGASEDDSRELEYRRSILNSALSSMNHALNNGPGSVAETKKASIAALLSSNDGSAGGVKPGECTDLPKFVRAVVEWGALVGDGRAYLQGWLLDPHDDVVGLSVQTGEASSGNILKDLARVHRGDVLRSFSDQKFSDARVGFVVLVSLESREEEAAPASSQHDWELIIETSSGARASVSIELQEFGRMPLELTTPFFTYLGAAGRSALDLLREHVGPAVEAAWEPLKPAVDREWSRDFGQLPEKPTCAVIVPLFARFDFLLYQLAEFSRDSDFKSVELIYVVDDPSILDATLKLAAEIAPIYRQPFRIVFPGQNLGYAGANNYGVSHSSAPLVLLLNSDVLPQKAGWLSKMIETYSGLDAPGALGVRLLFEDGTIQHDGMSFERRPEFPGLFLNDHPGKGLPVRLVPGEALEEVAAVTGACLMMSREKYLKLGGLDDGYILGDFEDSDLCLAAKKAGMKNYLLRSEALYHLERQSVSQVANKGWRRSITLYNAWRHTKKWGPELEALCEDRGAF